MNVAIVGTGYVGLNTSRALYHAMRNQNPDADFETASNPEFLREGANVRAHDPQGLDHARGALGTAPLGDCRDVESCVEGADVVVIVTDWPQYQLRDWARVRTAMAGNAIVDFRNLCDPDAIAGAGLRYHGIGRRVHGQRPAAGYSEVAA